METNTSALSPVISRRLGLKACCVVMVVLGSALPVLARIPGVKDPKAPTDRAFRQELFKFNRSTLSEAYLAVGRRDDEWDGDAIKFLDQIALYFTNANADFVSKLPADPVDRVIALGKSLVEDKKCDDGLVLYGYSVLLSDARQFKASYELLERAAVALDGSAYPAYRVASAIHRYNLEASTHYDREKFAAHNFRASLLDARLYTDATKYGVGRRAMLGTLFKFFNMQKPGEVLKSLDELAVNQASPPDAWLIEMLRGRGYVRAAIEAKGGEFVMNVPPDKAKGYHDNMALAKEHFLKAAALEPTYPESAAEMILVARQDGEALHTTPREWFDKALTAQIDFAPAYDNFRPSLGQGWENREEALFAFGQECLEGDRYDTALPGQYLNSFLQTVMDEGDTSFWERPEVYAKTMKVLMRLSTAPCADPAGSKQWYKSLAFALATRIGKYDEARTILDSLGGNVDARACRVMYVRPEESASRVSAWTGPAKDLVAKANSLVLDGNVPDASKTLETAFKKLPATDQGRPWVQSKITALKWREALAAPDAPWVDVTPGPTFDGWLQEAGKWSVDKDGSVVGSTDENPGLALLLATPPGDRFAVRFHARAETSDAAKMPAYMPRISPGLIVPFYAGPGYGGVFIDALSSKQTVRLFGSAGRKNQFDAVVRPDSLIEIEYTKPNLTVRIDGNVVVNAEPLRVDMLVPSARGEPVAPPRIGLTATHFSGRDDRVRFDHIEMRRIK